MKLSQPAKHLSRVLISLGIFATGSVMAQRIFKLLAAKNIVQIDAPVSGGVKGAEKGTVAVMASGPRQSTKSRPINIVRKSRRCTYSWSMPWGWALDRLWCRC